MRRLRTVQGLPTRDDVYRALLARPATVRELAARLEREVCDGSAIAFLVYRHVRALRRSGDVVRCRIVEPGSRIEWRAVRRPVVLERHATDRALAGLRAALEELSR